MTKITKAS